MGIIITGSGDTGDSPGNPLYFDDFDYVVDEVMTAAAKRTAFANGGGWTWAKDDNDSVGARGYLSTVTSIDGYAGTIPGLAGGHALRIKSTSLAQQGDLYLQWGDNAPGEFPAEGWLQFWYFMNNSTNEPSNVLGGKFWYPLAGGSQSTFPAPTEDTGFLLGLDTEYLNSSKSFVDSGDQATLAWTLEAMPISGATLADAPEADRRADVSALRSDLYNRMGPWEVQNTANAYLNPGTWYLIKMRWKLTGTGGEWELWRRVMGSQTWLKTHSWVDGTTANFNWNLHDPDANGWRLVRMPVTLRGDFWLYLTDIAVATSEANLPTYGSY